MPHSPRQVRPGSSVTTSFPDRYASGGQVIGSTASARRRRGSASGSPVNTCHQWNASSAQTVTVGVPSTVDSRTAEPPDTGPNPVSRTVAPTRLPVRKPSFVPATGPAPIGSFRPSTTSSRSPRTVSTTSSTATPGRRTYGCAPSPNGAGVPDRLVAVCLARNPSGPTDQVVVSSSSHGYPGCAGDT